MNLKEKHIKLMVLLVCLGIGSGAESIWGIRGLAIVMGTGMLWILGQIQKRAWLGNFCFFGLIIISIRGLLEDTQAVIFISGMVGSLVVWDLDRLMQRLQKDEYIRNKSLLIHQHLTRLGIILSLSFALFFIAFQIDVQLKFWYAIFLIGGVIIGISIILKNHYSSNLTQDDEN